MPRRTVYRRDTGIMLFRIGNSVGGEISAFRVARAAARRFGAAVIKPEQTEKEISDLLEQSGHAEAVCVSVILIYKLYPVGGADGNIDLFQFICLDHSELERALLYLSQVVFLFYLEIQLAHLGIKLYYSRFQTINLGVFLVYLNVVVDDEQEKHRTERRRENELERKAPDDARLYRSDSRHAPRGKT